MVLIAGLVGATGHGLVAQAVNTLDGDAWLLNASNSSISLVNGYSARAVAQTGVNGLHGGVQVVDTPGGAVISDQTGRLTAVSNDDFTTSGSIQLFGGAPATAAAGPSNASTTALYAVDEIDGQIQRLDDSGAALKAVGPRFSAGTSLATPVVAPDGSLYVAEPEAGAVGHLSNGRLATISGVAPSNDNLNLVLAGTEPVAVDLTTGASQQVGATAPIGAVTRAPAGFEAVQITGSDSRNGVVALAGSGAVDVVDTKTSANNLTTLPNRVAPSAAAMVGDMVVLIDTVSRDVLIVDTATHRLLPPQALPQKQVPDSLTVEDSLVFVNGSAGPSALVVNSTGTATSVSKYVPPPTPIRTTVPTPKTTNKPPPPVVTPSPGAKSGPPGAPTRPVATAGNSDATIGWGAAAPNGSAIVSYDVSWTGSTGDTGTATVPGGKLGTVVRGLSNGSSYVFSIAAVNGVGKGPAVSTAPVIPSGNVPDAPTNPVAATPTDNGGVTLTWTAADHGYNVSSYTIWQAGNAQPLMTGVAGTTTTIGTAQGLAVGTAVQFQVSAVGPTGASGALSAASQAVTPYLAPGSPAIQVTDAQSGTSATVSVSCDTACQQGRPAASYQVSGGTGQDQTIPANSDGSAITATITTSPNTSGTVSATVTDTVGTTGPAGTANFTAPGPPSAGGIGFNVNGQSITVNASVNTGGLSANCWVTVDGTSINQSGGCGSISISVPTYNTSYTAHFYVQNADGTGSVAGGFTSGTKSLTADATTAFGTCTSPNAPQYCGADSNVSSSPSFNASNPGPPIAGGTPVQAQCATSGGLVHGNQSGYTGGSSEWVKMQSSAGDGYMSVYWFPSPNSVTANLPGC